MFGKRLTLIFHEESGQPKQATVSPLGLRLGAAVTAALLVGATVGPVAGYHFHKKFSDATAHNNRLEHQLQLARLDVEQLEVKNRAMQASFDTYALQVQETVEKQFREKEREVESSLVLAERVDLNEVALTDWTVTPTRDRNLKLRFKVDNVTKAPVKGRVDLALVTREGNNVPLAADNPDLSFKIRRFKNIALNVGLPENLDMNDIMGIHVDVQDTARRTLLRETRPISQLGAGPGESKKYM